VVDVEEESALTRYIRIVRLAAATVLASLVSLSLSIAPAGAHLVCPPGVKKPAYCTNIPPLAVTLPATSVGTTTATLNGLVGGFGDNTQYFFQYGTSTAYGAQAPNPPGTVPGCPPGVSNPNYCVGSAPTQVSAAVTGLASNTTYHFRVVAHNTDGTTFGRDAVFTTGKIPITIKPIQFVHAPKRVKHGKRFNVVVRLRTSADVTIELVLKGNVVRSFDEGTRKGTFRQRIKAPKKKGKYVISVTATGGGTTQTVNRTIKVF
jgi:hypothetical protein